MIGIPKPTKEQRLNDKIARLKEKVKVKKEPRLSDLKKIVQRKVNAYIRERDKDLPCISCQKHNDKKEAGHYVAQGSSGFLRYHVWNLNAQCKSCNRFMHGNLINYRVNLVKKIGAKNVEWLENHRHDVHKWTREELLAIKESLQKPIDK